MRCYYPNFPENEQALRDFVAREDARFEGVLDEVTERIASASDLKLIGLTGPTCSGKTTAAKKLTDCLEKQGHRVQVISIDDF